MPDIKWSMIGDYSPDLSQVAVASKELREAVNAFRRNVDRLLNLPWLVSWMKDTVQLAADWAQGISTQMGESASVFKKAEALRRAMIERKNPVPTEGDTQSILFFSEIEDFMRWRWTAAAQVAVESMLSSMTVGAWTAFEVLATDVWVEAVNHRPGSLGSNAWTGRRSGGDDVPPDRLAKAEFGIDLMREYGFDLSQCMGTMMWRRRRFDFNTLQGISEAYKEAFKTKGPDGRTALPTEVKGWFSGEDYDTLKLTEAIRHATVHRGGLADAAFLARVGCHPIFGQLKPNDPIPLNGEIVRNCIGGTVRAGTALLLGVDKWLKDNTK